MRRYLKEYRCNGVTSHTASIIVEESTCTLIADDGADAGHARMPHTTLRMMAEWILENVPQDTQAQP